MNTIKPIVLPGTSPRQPQRQQQEPKRETQIVFQFKEIISDLKNYDVHFVVRAVKHIIGHPDSYTREDRKCAAQHLMAHPENYSVAEYSYVAKLITAEENRHNFSSAEYEYAANQLNGHPKNYDIDMRVYEAKRIIEIPSSNCTKEKYAAAIRFVMGHPAMHTKNEYEQAADFIIARTDIFTDLKEREFATQHINGHAENYQGGSDVETAKRMIYFPEKYDVAEYAKAVKHIIRHPRSYTPQEFNLAADALIQYHDQTVRPVVKPKDYKDEAHLDTLKQLTSTYKKPDSIYNSEDIYKAAQVIIKYNHSFFTAPIDKQNDFTALFTNCGNKSVMEAYSNGLCAVLTPNCYHNQVYLEYSTVVLWHEKKFDDALALDDNISVFVLRNRNHEAITLWNKFS